MQDNPLWTYSLAVYGRRGVEPVLLRLQDDYGADINMLLCCCWVAGEARQLTDENIQALVRVSIKWRAQCIMPLRGVRRFLSAQPGAECLYDQLKALELEAEQWQQDVLFSELSAVGLTASALAVKALALQHLQVYCRGLPGVDWGDIAGLLEELVTAVGLKE